MAENDSAEVQKSEIAHREEETFNYWQENKIFQKTLEKEAPNGDYVFYDGPPFATGVPHYGHILAGTIKDIIPRYKTMRGYHVPRRWGWDCHGLPLENIVEKELDLKTKKDIEDFGIKAFNETARVAVLRYADDWKKIIPRLGRWVDMDNDYRTMDASYSETVWWIFKTLHEKGLIYEGYKSMHICPRCETTLANFEVNQGYKDITDISVFVKFELVDEPGTYFVAWTTTPWTLPGNVALAVGHDVVYVKARKEGVIYILAKQLVEKVLKADFEIIEELTGDQLVGKSYKPVFDYYVSSDIDNKENGWKVYAADFVTTEDGTGIVHIAPAFGDDDYLLAQRHALPFIQHVGMDGKFKSEVVDFAGQAVKPKDDHQKIDIEIIKYLAGKGTLFAKEKIVHSYPHCWRCDTPLLNYAASSWFVRVTQIKDELVKSNKNVSWVPEHIKEGRFGKWLEGVRDWAISRSRFWGAPLPVWRCEECDDIKVFGSVKELQSQQATVDYAVMRHGEAEHNQKHIVSCVVTNEHHLTEAGKIKARETAEALKGKGIDTIIASDFMRTKETAIIVAEILGLPSEAIVYDERLREVNFGDLNGKSFDDFHTYLDTLPDRFTTPLGGGESYLDVRKRVGGFIYDINKTYRDRKPLIITHESLVWLLHAVSRGMTIPEALEEKGYLRNDFLLPGEMVHIDFAPLPHNDNYELDLHRPYIDDVKLPCACGGAMTRVPDVFDCWFESGSMPYGQAHYLGQPLSQFDPVAGRGFPADFIAEGLDQTRGWFYSLMVLGTALFGTSPFKNVIVNGLVLAEDGQKMSKRLKNYPDPMYIVNKFGADALRFYLIASPIVRAEDLNFSEKGVGEIYRKIIMRLDNTYAFYVMYAGEEKPQVIESKNILDQWVLARLNQMIAEVESAMEAYELDRALRPIDEFIDDLSNWYVRRSRDRFKSEDVADRNAAISTLQTVLVELLKVMAPFTPFIAEDLYKKLGGEGESIHLAAWPKVGSVDQAIIAAMAQTRQVVSLGLEARAAAGIKVRQPLATLSIKIALPEAYHDLIANEVNVKNIIVDQKLETEVALDIVITDELRDEGVIRELARHIQEERKKRGYVPQDIVTIAIATNVDGERVIATYGQELAKAVNAKVVTSTPTVEGELKVAVEGVEFHIAMEK